MVNASHIRRPHTSVTQSLTARQVAVAYNFPLAKATGKGCRIGLIELGGGASLTELHAALAAKGLSTYPAITFKSVGSGRNNSDGPQGADGEVQSDILVAAEIATGSAITVYFAGNNDTDFLAVIKQALAENDVVSLSWGGPEASWDAATLDEFEAAIKVGRDRGVPLFVAAGDSGSNDGEKTASVDFPASAPSAIGCGGTRLVINSSGARLNEVVWDDNDTTSATGGGASKHFLGRDVPDIAGNADPNTGYQVTIDGDDMVIGGTSLAAPLFAALYALLWELDGGKGFDFLNLVVTNPSTCFDVTSGDNGAYRAGPGRDETTGFGVPDGGLLATALLGGITPPVPPTPTPPVVGDPLADFPVAAFNTLARQKHNYTVAESNAVSEIAAWGNGHGLALV